MRYITKPKSKLNEQHIVITKSNKKKTITINYIFILCIFVYKIPSININSRFVIKLVIIIIIFVLFIGRAVFNLLGESIRISTDKYFIKTGKIGI